MKKIFVLFFIFVFSVLTCSSFAQIPAEALALTGNGARAAGMGNAFTGVADDATAIYWNPAGLTQLQSMEASIVGRLSFGSGSVDFPSDQYIPFYYDPYNDVWGLWEVNSWDIEVASQFQINFASFVFPFQLGQNNVVGGIAFRKLYDFSQEATNTIRGDLTEYDQYWGTFTPIGELDLETFSSVSGGVNAISPSIGFQLNDMFSFGATVNILTGSAEFETYEEVNDIKITEGDMEMDFSGTAIDLGVLVKPSPTFSIGANLSLPHTVTAEIEGEEEDTDIPMFFSIGAGLRATDNLLLAFDYRSRPWSDAEDEDGDPIAEEDANSIHIGMEYLMMAGNNVMPLRLGFYTQPLPAQDAQDDPISNNVITAGIGLIMGNIILDGSFEYVMSSYAALETYDGDPIDFSGNEFRISIGAVIHFEK